LASGQVIAVATRAERHGLVMALASRWQFLGR
jgi:hypothetical protein